MTDDVPTCLVCSLPTEWHKHGGGITCPVGQNVIR